MSDPGAALRIAMLAPPWIAVPPPGYGGVETVVSALTEELTSQGHAVTLFCAPGSWSTATVREVLDAAHPGEIERAVYESDHVGRALAEIVPVGEISDFDVLHDHSGFTLLAMADRIDIPVVHTIHGPLDLETGAFYAEHGHKASLIAISEAQLASAPTGVHAAAVIANPIDVSTWVMERHKDDYVLWIGRITEEKGPHRAIAAARQAGVPIVLAGVVQPGQEAFFTAEIAPHLGHPDVRFVGEIGGAPKRALFAGARALLMPIRWPEPFGMVMIEALASGTPVIAFPEGAAKDLVIDGVTGFLVDDEAQMAAAIGALPSLSAMDCRRWALAHCDVHTVAAAYVSAYRAAIAGSQPLVVGHA